MKYEINIGDDFVDDIARLALINSLNAVETEIAALKAERKMLRKQGQELPSYRNEDFCYDKMMRKALLKVIRYYSTPEQWHAYLETQA